MEILQDYKRLVELYYNINSDIPFQGSSIDREKEMPYTATSHAIEAEVAVYKAGLRNIQVGNRHKFDWSIIGNKKM